MPNSRTGGRVLAVLLFHCTKKVDCLPFELIGPVIVSFVVLYFVKEIRMSARTSNYHRLWVHLSLFGLSPGIFPPLSQAGRNHSPNKCSATKLVALNSNSILHLRPTPDHCHMQGPTTPRHGLFICACIYYITYLRYDLNMSPSPIRNSCSL